MLASAPFMPDGLVLVIALLFMLVGALYASVGHAGASGYLALMAIMGVDALVMRPTALTLNVLVGTIAFVQFARAGHFRWRLFWPFAVASVPMAYVGGAAHVPAGALKVAIGVVLLLTACRMVWTNLRPRPETEAPLRAMPLPAALVCAA
ncbi:MAG: sulfite exporter TauE/SafE family protein [Phycisphaerales bacterium]|nr:MAG: sulfite exporter TauE/SafE family protein [Phycisphaerales bacterium]